MPDERAHTRDRECALVPGGHVPRELNDLPSSHHPLNVLLQAAQGRLGTIAAAYTCHARPVFTMQNRGIVERTGTPLFLFWLLFASVVTLMQLSAKNVGDLGCECHASAPAKLFRRMGILEDTLLWDPHGDPGASLLILEAQVPVIQLPRGTGFNADAAAVEMA